MPTQDITLTTGQNTVFAKVTGSTLARLLDGATEVGKATGIDPSGSYGVEWTSLSVKTYTVDTDGAIDTVSASNTPSIVPANQRYTPEGYPKYALAAPADTEGIPVVATAPYSATRQFYEKGNADAPFIAAPDSTNIFDTVIDATMVGADNFVQLFAGEYWCDANVQSGDYLEFSVIDKDGVLGYAPPGTVVELAKYVKKRPAKANATGAIVPGQATKLYIGLYLRAIYFCVSGGVDRKLEVSYKLAK